MKKANVFLTVMLVAVSTLGFSQGFESDPVFRVRIHPDRAPAVAGEELRLAIEVSIDSGWHINSDNPGDEFSLPTEVEFELPEGWLVAGPGRRHLLVGIKRTRQQQRGQRQRQHDEPAEKRDERDEPCDERAQQRRPYQDLEIEQWIVRSHVEQADDDAALGRLDDFVSLSGRVGYVAQ